MNFKLALILVGALFGLSGLALAQEASTAVAEVAAPAAPVPDKGDTVWMMISTILVIMMVIPGLALFYGGLVRAKNMLSVLAQVFSIFCLIIRKISIGESMQINFICTYSHCVIEFNFWLIHYLKIKQNRNANLF